MKKYLLVALFELIGIVCCAQVVRKEGVSVSIASPDISCISFDCFVQKDEATNPIDSVTIIISSKTARDTINTKNENFAFTDKLFRSKKLHFTVSRRGYETIEQDFITNSNVENLLVFLKKED